MEKTQENKGHAITKDVKADKLDKFFSRSACECGGLIKDAGGHCRTCQANGLEDEETQFISFKTKGRRFSSGYESPLDQFLNFLAINAKYKEHKVQGKVVGMYKFQGEIGCGGFSKVKLATHIFTKEQVAIKIIDKSRYPGNLEKILAQEVRCMEILNHPNLIRLYEVIESAKKIHLVTEWAPAGNLDSIVKANGKIVEADAKLIFSQIVDAILYMHDNGIYHRDIKAENVLLCSPTVCKICDFGFSTVGRKGKFLSTFCGSPAYSAPELCQKVLYDGGPADVWSLGILLYFVTEGRLPFNGNFIAALKKEILEGHYETSEDSSSELVQLLEMILKQKPEERLTVAQIKNHPWLSQLDEATGLPSSINTYPFNNFAIYDVQESILSNLGSAYQSYFEESKENAGSNRNLTGNCSQEVNFNLIPTKKQIMFRLVTKQEVKAYEILLEIGATEAKIRAHKPRGMRSYLVGIYRIILHKIQRGEHIDVNKMGLRWDMSASMMNLNSCANVEQSKDLKEKDIREEKKTIDHEENKSIDHEENKTINHEENKNTNQVKETCRDTVNGDVHKEKKKLEKSQSIDLGDLPTSVSSQKKRMLGNVVSTKVCVIL